jgi:lipopolysaccharide transport system permease protein
LVPWTFFATSLSFGIPSLVNNMNLVTKIYFPREVLPLASTGAAFVDFLAAAVVFVGMVVLYRAWPSVHAWWVIPLLAVQITLTIGVTLLGSAIIVFFRDMRFVVPLVIQVWMYATPVIYPVELVPERLWPYYFVNPMAGVIDGYRRVLLMGQPPRPLAVLLGALVSFLLLVLSYTCFKRAEHLFADLI